MTAKKAATSAKHKTTVTKHAATKKHTETAKQKAAHSAAAKKAAATRKKDKVTAKAKAAVHAKAAKAVSFAVGDWLPVCGFEAVAQSLRLAGQFVHDDEVAGLWDLSGADPLGASLAATLDAASLHGLAGFRPRWKRVAAPVAADHLALPLAEDEAVSVDPFEDFFAGQFHDLILGAAGGRDSNPQTVPFSPAAGRPRQHLILRIDVPGPHAVLATRDGWWSWGELHEPWRCNVLEAWAVSWS